MPAEWIFEYTTPLLLLATGIVGGLLLTGFLAWRHLPPERSRWILLGLRLLFLLLLAWALLLPARRRSITELIRPRFAVVLDTSSSMQQAVEPDSGTNRWTVAQEMFQRDWTRHLGAEARLDLFTLEADISPPLPLSRAHDLAPAGQASHLRDGLNRIVERYRGQDLLGLLLLSDGIDTRETSDDWSLAGLPVPLYAVRLEEPRVEAIVPDVRVDALDTPRRVVVNWESRLSAVIAGQPIPGEPFPVRLLQDGQLVEEQPVQLPPEGGRREISFRLQHPEVGSSIWTVEIRPLAGESNTNDNQMAVAVEVVDARNRVLYIEDVPRWDSRFLNRELYANASLTPLSFVRGPEGRFISYTAAGTETLDMSAEHLRLYTIVIVGDLDAETLGGQRAEALREFTERGGSLVLLGGTKAWGREGLLATALDALIPVQRVSPEPASSEERLATRWGDEAQAHPSFAAADRELTQDLPPLLSVFESSNPSAAATVLVESETPAGWVPVVLAQPYGQGKVMAVLTDSLWRWQLDPAPETPYGFFWTQTLEWLSPSETPLEAYELELIAENNQVFPGESIALNARLGGLPEALDTLPGQVVLQLQTPDGRTLPLRMPQRRILAAGREFSGYGLDYTPPMPGTYRAQAEVELDGQTIASTPFMFRVHAYTQEDLPRPAADQVLRNLALTSGGRYGAPEDIDRMLRALRAESRREQRVEYATLWRTWWVLTCLMGLLVVEWILRKMWNMV